MNKLLVFWVAVLLLFAGLFTTWYVMQRAKQQPATGQEETDYGPPLESFVLTQSTGDQFNSQSLAGDIWVCNFFYASCPSICLRENFAVQELAEQFAHRGVRFVSITIDPTNDTPSRLADYSKKFNADPKQWFFLTGKMEYIQRVGNDIFQTQIEPGGHTERLFVIDRSGTICGAYHFQDASEMQDMRTKLNELLSEEPADANESSDESAA